MDCPSCKKSTCSQCRSPVSHRPRGRHPKPEPNPEPEPEPEPELNPEHKSEPEPEPEPEPASVLLQWSPQHEGVSCQHFRLWQQQNQPDHLSTQLWSYQSIGTNPGAGPGWEPDLLSEASSQGGMFLMLLSPPLSPECPRCQCVFSLSRGGCLHFTCSQCRHQFCGGCGRGFSQGSVSPGPGCRSLLPAAARCWTCVSSGLPLRC